MKFKIHYVIQAVLFLLGAVNFGYMLYGFMTANNILRQRGTSAAEIMCATMLIALVLLAAGIVLLIVTRKKKWETSPKRLAIFFLLGNLPALLIPLIEVGLFLFIILAAIVGGITV